MIRISNPENKVVELFFDIPKYMTKGDTLVLRWDDLLLDQDVLPVDVVVESVVVHGKLIKRINESSV